MAEPNKEEENKPRRKKKAAKHHAGHHGGAWKVAFADFMTAMMALFLVLWLVSQADTKLKQAIAQYFRSPGVFDTMKGGILSQAKKVSREPTSLTSKDDEQGLFSVAQRLEKSISSRPEFKKYKDQIRIQVTDEGLKIELIDEAERVSFPSGSSNISAEAKMILEEIAKGLCELPNKINIGGHTDSQIFASDNGYSNWELSADRANAARRVLQSICVKPEQINRIVGYADTEPLDPSNKMSPSNRRISIMVLRLAMENSDSAAADDKEASEIIEKRLKDKESQPIKEKSNSENSQKEETKSISNSNISAENKAVESEKKSESSTETEKKSDKTKLMNSGAVKVGEPDIVPNKPKIKE
ncbi:MAG TPA: flagellar motor protein MotB [Pyrinomonadaceae bacterium]|nr:flagellar motor protein MotB [Pyrinomonadaceae bacterium]